VDEIGPQPPQLLVLVSKQSHNIHGDPPPTILLAEELASLVLAGGCAESEPPSRTETINGLSSPSHFNLVELLPGRPHIFSGILPIEKHLLSQRPGL